jgi:hypothetical protein
MVYPAGPFEDWKQPVGYCGILPDETGLKEGAYDVGDVNGDGYDDIAILGRPGSTTQESTWYSRFWIIGGSPKLQTNIFDPYDQDGDSMVIFPNPSSSGNTVIIVQLPESLRGHLLVMLHNVLGQEVYRKEIIDDDMRVVSIGIPHNLQPGLYLVSVASDSAFRNKLIVIV